MTKPMGLTRAQKDALDYITLSIESTGVSPSYDEIRGKLYLKSKSGVHRIIGALEAKGHIHRLARRAHSLALGRSPTVCCPFCSNEFAPYARFKKFTKRLAPGVILVDGKAVA